MVSKWQSGESGSCLPDLKAYCFNLGGGHRSQKSPPFPSSQPRTPPSLSSYPNPNLSPGNLNFTFLKKLPWQLYQQPTGLAAALDLDQPQGPSVISSSTPRLCLEHGLVGVGREEGEDIAERTQEQARSAGWGGGRTPFVVWASASFPPPSERAGKILWKKLHL